MLGCGRGLGHPIQSQCPIVAFDLTDKILLAWVYQICQIAVYSCFLAMFSSVTGPAQILHTRKQEPFEMLKHRSSLSKSGDPIVGRNGLNMVSVLELGVLVICATLGRLATTGIDLAVDRDW